MKLPICDKLRKLKEEGRVPFHMPGHKRKPMELFEDICSMDITEITGYDNLHHPQGIILESMNLLKEVYGSRKSWYLVNGSTVGILAAISAVCQPGDHIMVARNCHKSVYNAIRLLHLKPLYLYPSYSSQYDMFQGITEEEIREMDGMLRESGKVKAVVITSPTYEGIVSDVRAIKAVTSGYGIPLIVDEAHGAHFIFHDYFPQSAVECGADIVVQSAHKTLPAFTQTALLHLCSDMVKEDRIDEMLSIYETSSPSYLLMASAEYGALYTHNHADKVNNYVDKLSRFRKKCAQLRHIHILDNEKVRAYDYDRGKLVILVKNSGIDGKELFEIMLRDHHIEFEMESAAYCIAMTSVCDSEEDFKVLEDALFAVDSDLDRKMISADQGRANKEVFPNREMDKSEIFQDQERGKKENSNNQDPCRTKITADAGQIDTDWEKGEQMPCSLFIRKPEQAMTSWQALSCRKESLPLSQASERIAGDYIYLYPPGIPVLVPGEKITKEMVANLNYYLYNGYNIPTLDDGRITVIHV